MTLHVINKADPACWHPLLDALGEGDVLLLIEDAVEAALPSHPLARQLEKLEARVPVHVLADDLVLRGIFGKISHGIARTNYHDFVLLSVAQNRVINWR